MSPFFSFNPLLVSMTFYYVTVELYTIEETEIAPSEIESLLISTLPSGSKIN